MSDEQVEYHVSIQVTKHETSTIVEGKPVTNYLPVEKWKYVAVTFPNEEDAIDCADVMKGFLLGM